MRLKIFLPTIFLITCSLLSFGVGEESENGRSLDLKMLEAAFCSQDGSAIEKAILNFPASQSEVLLWFQSNKEAIIKLLFANWSEDIKNELNSLQKRDVLHVAHYLASYFGFCEIKIISPLFVARSVVKKIYKESSNSFHDKLLAYLTLSNLPLQRQYLIENLRSAVKSLSLVAAQTSDRSVADGIRHITGHAASAAKQVAFDATYPVIAPCVKKAGMPTDTVALVKMLSDISELYSLVWMHRNTKIYLQEAYDAVLSKLPQTFAPWVSEVIIGNLGMYGEEFGFTQVYPGPHYQLLRFLFSYPGFPDYASASVAIKKLGTPDAPI